MYQVQWWKGTHHHRHTKCATNFKADAEALVKAAVEIRDNLSRTWPNVVIFTLYSLCSQQLQNPRQKDLSEVETALVDLAAQTNLTLQRISAHCGIQGNEQADRLAREGDQLDQRTDTPLTLMKRPSSKPSPRKNGSSNTQTLTRQTFWSC